jgi:hypothetical protein
MEPTRLGKAVGAKLARSLIAQFAGKRDAALEKAWPEGSRHQVFLLSDDRVVDVFLKSARLYATAEEFRQDRAATAT